MGFTFDNLEEQAAGTVERSPEVTGASAAIVAAELKELGVGTEQPSSTPADAPVASDGGQVRIDNGAERDSAGTAFDPALHTGSKLKDGTWRKKKGVSAPGSRVVSSRSTAAPSVELAEKPFNPAAAKAAAKMATQAYFSTTRLFGKEFKPDPDELANVGDAMEAYFIAKQIDTFPPGTALVIAMSGHIGSRMSSPEKYPETAQKVSRLKLWFALRIARAKLRKEFKKQGLDPNRIQIVNGDLMIDGNPANFAQQMADLERNMKD